MKSLSAFLIRCSFIFLLLHISCSKEKFKPVTINGQTFGCQVDGKLFIPDKWDYGNNIAPIRIYFSRITYGGVTLRVVAEKENEYIEIFLNKPLTQGVHPLLFKTREYPVYDPPKDNGVYVIKSLAPAGIYITNDTIGGYVDLLFIDTINLKVNAKFEFIGTDRITNKQVKVTNGIFKNY
jgi:hypothetical protein